MLSQISQKSQISLLGPNLNPPTPIAQQIPFVLNLYWPIVSPIPLSEALGQYDADWARRDEEQDRARALAGGGTAGGGTVGGGTVGGGTAGGGTAEGTPHNARMRYRPQRHELSMRVRKASAEEFWEDVADGIVDGIASGLPTAFQLFQPASVTF